MGTPSGSERTLITDITGITEIEDEWRALAEIRSNAFLTPEWLHAWWEHMGEGRFSLLIAALRRAGALVGVMPLKLDATGRPRAIRFAGASLGDRFHPLARPEDESAVAAAAIAMLEQRGLTRHMLLFEHAEPGRPWQREMQARSRRRLKLTEQPQTAQPYIRLEGLDWETYVAQRSKKFRQQLRRRERVMIREHAMEGRLANAETLEADLDTFFRLHELRWRGRAPTSLLDPDVQATLRDFARAAVARGWLRLHVVEAEGAPVAAMLAWRVGETYAYYNSGFDPAWSQKSIGTVLIGVAIRSAIEEGAVEFDFLLGGEAYKRNFTAEARRVENIVLTPALRPVTLLVAGEARARSLGRRLLGGPRLERLRRKLRAVLPTSRP